MSFASSESSPQPKKTCFTFEITEDQTEKLLGLMVTGNYRQREVPYALYSIEGNGFNATVYSKVKHGKRKLCIQGSKAEDFVLFSVEPLVLGSAGLGYEDVLDPLAKAPHGGSDESGKGDYFGPLVVCCCYVDHALAETVQKLGARDCKKMTDSSVLKVGAELRKALGPSGYSFVKIGPAAYNRLYAKIKNINRLLAWAHAKAIDNLLALQPTCPRIVIDQFARTEAVITRALTPRARKITIDQHHKAESDIAVAAASVIAREIFLREMIKMSQEVYGEAKDEKGEPLRLPIGSSSPRVREVACEQVQAKGPVWLMNHCKAHFQTTDKVLTACGFSRDDLPPEGQVVSLQAKKEQEEAQEA